MFFPSKGPRHDPYPHHGSMRTGNRSEVPILNERSRVRDRIQSREIEPSRLGSYLRKRKKPWGRARMKSAARMAAHLETGSTSLESHPDRAHSVTSA